MELVAEEFLSGRIHIRENTTPIRNISITPPDKITDLEQE